MGNTVSTDKWPVPSQIDGTDSSEIQILLAKVNPQPNFRSSDSDEVVIINVRLAHEKDPPPVPPPIPLPSPCPRHRKGCRPIIIDGSNVAMSHLQNGEFSCKGLQVVVNYFHRRRHTVYIYVPRYRSRHFKTKDRHILDKLHKEKIVLYTKCGQVNGKRFTTYDDLQIIDAAFHLGGVIVSNDKYRDVCEIKPEWREIIEERVLGFTWVTPTYIQFPDDPLGRNGPTLEKFLRF